ncbi:alpha/beta fold hydrolase [Pseudobacteriovorax antillogorgiicola]|uniref:2-succinyl-6-hydroxy-2,4-cyclohexadiene-1-carboxylate synthase n=1 Tax=Pseudobacteriovorax antillogorgiicola TaxID=1513793 RepID=A0A1Y6BIE7_9BACT|nr:alpha/beta fold hydrolase [Pseudobacteriovorax antillogorgiicola]TCS55489.1 2-succinyl-6-hydroxy-2,4-cyclohexadiene-1-carboxylate synthase [Pseudobacteriovorax antillogorgiicola]SMF11816.1 2-succinyl-6-hydroxy-2,4-cyclohexadiene-1-carboxylate synthase [Pseudobacteriovorax antillogorgiicola]
MTLFSRVVVGSKPVHLTVVMLHGFMGDHRDWLPVVQGLPQAGIKYVLYDLPCHGQSLLSEEANPWTDFESITRSLWQDIRSEQQGRLIVLGYSLGGRLALRLKAQCPGDIDHLLIESASFGISSLGERESRYQKDQFLLQDVLAGRRSFRDFLEAWYRLPLFRGLGACDGFEPMLARRLSQSPEQIQRSLQFLSVGSMVATDHFADDGKQLSFISGVDDKKYAAIMSQLPLSWKTYAVPGASHNVHLQQKHAFIDIVSRALGKYT